MRTKLKIWAPLMCLCVGATLAFGANAIAGSGDGGSSIAATTSTDFVHGTRDEIVTVNGSGGGTLQLRGFEGDTVSFRFHATANEATPWDATGVFSVTHVRPDGTVLADFGGTVDCLMQGADVAVFTGTITRGGAAGIPGEEVGHRVGLTVADHGRRDHLGWSWLVLQFQDALPCTSTAPFFPITAGNFRVGAR